MIFTKCLVIFITIQYIISTTSCEGVCSTTTSTSVDSNVIFTPNDYPVQLSMDIYYPIDYNPREKLPCSIFVHGGLWQSGSNDAQSSINYAKNVVIATRTIVAPIQYRLTSDTTCCSTDHTCNLGIQACNGKCSGTYPDFLQDFNQAFNFLKQYDKCDSKIFCLGHSAGGQICTQAAIEMESNNGLIGFIGIGGIYNLTKFYVGPKGEGYECSIEKAFSSNGLIWCINGDNACNPLIINGYKGAKGLFVHSPEDTLVLNQQAEEIACRLNGISEEQCGCHGYHMCICLNMCLGDSNSYAQYTNDVSGDHYGVLSTVGLANVTRDFICPLTVQ
eukprot:20333_1